MKKIKIIAVIVMATMLLAACGAPAATTAATTTAAAEATTAATEATEAATEAAAETTAETTAAPAAELSDDECRTELAPLLVGLSDVDGLAAGAVTRDEEDKIAGENEGEEYLKVTDERFKSLADLGTFMDSYITENLRKSQFSGVIDDANCIYIEKDGALYVFNGGRGSGFAWTETPAEITDKTAESFTATKEYDMFGKMSKIKLGLVKTDNGWRIDTFEYAD